MQLPPRAACCMQHGTVRRGCSSVCRQADFEPLIGLDVFAVATRQPAAPTPLQLLAVSSATSPPPYLRLRLCSLAIIRHIIMTIVGKVVASVALAQHCCTEWASTLAPLAASSSSPLLLAYSLPLPPFIRFVCTYLKQVLLLFVAVCSR